MGLQDGYFSGLGGSAVRQGRPIFGGAFREPVLRGDTYGGFSPPFLHTSTDSRVCGLASEGVMLGWHQMVFQHYDMVNRWEWGRLRMASLFG